MFTITHINSNGQFVIPASLRKKYGINPETHIKVYDNDKTICIEPVLNVDTSTRVDFPKRKKFTHFKPIKSKGSYANKVDKIIY